MYRHVLLLLVLVLSWHCIRRHASPSVDPGHSISTSQISSEPLAESGSLGSGYFLDSASAVKLTSCNAQNVCQDATITADGPSDALDASNIDHVFASSCDSTSCSQTVRIERGALLGAAAGVAAVALVGAVWYFRYFKTVEWQADALPVAGARFAANYPPASSPSQLVSGLKGKALAAFDLDETLVDETYHPDTVQATPGASPPQGWMEVTVDGAKCWVRQPRFKPGALATLSLLLDHGHDLGVITYNHRIGVAEALQTSLLNYRVQTLRHDLAVEIPLIAARFKVSAPTIGQTSNPLRDFGATKSIFLDFEGGKAALAQKLVAAFPAGAEEFDALLFTDDKNRFIHQMLAAKLGIPVVSLKIEGNRATEGFSDVTHFAFLRGLCDPEEYAKAVTLMRKEDPKADNHLVLDGDAMTQMLSRFNAKAQALADTKGLAARKSLTGKTVFATDMAAKTASLEGDALAKKQAKFKEPSKTAAFLAGLGIVAAAAAVGAGIGGAVEQQSQ